jgi:hypothetical protein
MVAQVQTRAISNFPCVIVGSLEWITPSVRERCRNTTDNLNNATGLQALFHTTTEFGSTFSVIKRSFLA